MFWFMADTRRGTYLQQANSPEGTCIIYLTLRWRCKTLANLTYFDMGTR
jgi:hypothetical protein